MPVKQNTRELALAAVSAALAVVLMAFGGVIPLATYAAPLLAMLALIPAVSSCRPSLALLSYAAAALLGLMLVPDREISFLFLFLGYYPVLRPKLQKIRPELLRAAVKLFICFAAVGAMYALLIFVFRMDALREEFSFGGMLTVVLFFLLGAVTFLLYDKVLERFTFMYRRRFAGKEKQ